MSTAILALSENGELQRIQDKWLKNSACSSQSTDLESKQLHLKSFWGLFLICGLACFLSLFIYFSLMIREFIRHPLEESDISQGRSRPRRLQTFLSFVDEKEESWKSKSKRRQMEKSNRNVTNASSSSH